MHDVPAEYEQTVGFMVGLRQQAQAPAGDPDRAAEIIIEVVRRGNPPSHLLLGVNAVEMALAYSHDQIAEATAWEKVGRSADVAEPYPAPLPPLDV